MATSEQSFLEDYTFADSALLHTEDPEPLSGLGICYRQLDLDYSDSDSSPFWGQYDHDVSNYWPASSDGSFLSIPACVSPSDLQNPSTSGTGLEPSLSQAGTGVMQISADAPSSESSSRLSTPSSLLWEISDQGWMHPPASSSMSEGRAVGTTLFAPPAYSNGSSRTSSSPPPSAMSSMFSRSVQPRKRKHQQEAATRAWPNQAEASASVAVPSHLHTEFCGDEDIAEDIDDGDDERDEDYSPGAPKRRKKNAARRASNGTSRRTSTNKAPSGRRPRDHHSSMGAQSRMRSAAPRAHCSSGMPSATTPATVPATAAALSSTPSPSSRRTTAASSVPAEPLTTRNGGGVGDSSATSSNLSEELTPFRCYPCRKSFGRKGDLQRHRQTTKRCPCFDPANAPRCTFPGCGRSFGRLDSCRRHLKTCNFKPLAQPEEL